MTPNPSLAEAVQQLMNRIFDRYVCEPNLVNLESDLIVALKRFRVSVRRRWAEVEKRRAARLLRGDDSSNDDEIGGEPVSDESGFGTGLRDQSRNGDDHDNASREVDAFLAKVEQ